MKKVWLVTFHGRGSLLHLMHEVRPGYWVAECGAELHAPPAGPGVVGVPQPVANGESATNVCPKCSVAK